MSTRYQGKAEGPLEGPRTAGDHHPREAARSGGKKPPAPGSESQTGQPAEAPCRPVWMLSLIAVALVLVGLALMAEAVR
jgi:hypothetical protein